MASAPRAVRSGTVVLISSVPDVPLFPSGESRTKLMPVDENEFFQDRTSSAHEVYVSQVSLRGSAFQAGNNIMLGTYDLPDTVRRTKDMLFVQMPGLEDQNGSHIRH